MDQWEGEQMMTGLTFLFECSILFNFFLIFFGLLSLMFYLASFINQRDRKFVRPALPCLSDLTSMFWYICVLFVIVFKV